MKSILIIEDSNDVRENIAEILELSGYKTHTAANGKLGIDLAMEQSPDLILCDVMMPELDGFGVLKILRTKSATATTPFIFLTAKTESSDLRKGMGLGADDYITKPFDDVELLDAIEVRLKKSEALSKRYARKQKFEHAFPDENKGFKLLKDLALTQPSRHYKKRENLYREDDLANSCFFIESGKVKISKVNEDGKELITDILQKGDFLPCQSVLLNETYQHQASCLEDCTIHKIPKADFMSLLNQNSDFNAYFVKNLAFSIQKASDYKLRLAYDSVRKRLADALILLHNRYEGEGIAIYREDLAALAGTAKETATRMLSEFREAGMLNIIDTKIHIVNLDGLKTIPY